MMSSAGEAAAEIFLWRLHYGKLAQGRDLSIPARESYGVTRRSRGLSPDDDALLTPARLLGLRRLEPDFIDAPARESGCLALRADNARLSILRARFRPEDGDGGHGRLYQQSAVWIADARDWRAHPAALLAIAGADILATPDAVEDDEAARFGESPLRYRVERLDPECVRAALEESFEQSGWALEMLDLLAIGAETGADATLTFGADDFCGEEDFLAAVGLALQALPPDYPRWRDVNIVSGLRAPTTGLCLRYLPSWRASDAGPIAENSVAA